MTIAISPTTSASVSPEKAKLQQAARDFESILIADLLKSAPRSGSLDGGETQGAGLEGYDDLRTEAMASALAAQGGIGIARMLLKQLQPEIVKSDIKAFSSSADHVIAREY
jgi:Rod binding domain-containing protein